MLRILGSTAILCRLDICASFLLYMFHSSAFTFLVNLYKYKVIEISILNMYTKATYVFKIVHKYCIMNIVWNYYYCCN